MVWVNGMNFFSSFLNWMSYMPSCVIRPSVKICAYRFFSQMATTLAHHGPRWACIQGVLKVKVEDKGHVIWALLWFHKNCFISQANDWIVTKLTPSLTSPSLFFRTPISKWLWDCTVSSAVAHIVKQFVKLLLYSKVSCSVSPCKQSTLAFQSQYQAAKSNV